MLMKVVFIYPQITQITQIRRTRAKELKTKGYDRKIIKVLSPDIPDMFTNFRS